MIERAIEVSVCVLGSPLRCYFQFEKRKVARKKRHNRQWHCKFSTRSEGTYWIKETLFLSSIVCIQRRFECSFEHCKVPNSTARTVFKVIPEAKLREEWWHSNTMLLVSNGLLAASRFVKVISVRATWAKCVPVEYMRIISAPRHFRLATQTRRLNEIDVVRQLRFRMFLLRRPFREGGPRTHMGDAGRREQIT